MLQDFLASHNIDLMQTILPIIGYLMTIPLSMMAINYWHHYRQELYISKIKWTLLEVLVPRDIVKTPAAMELILSNAFYHKGKKGFWEEFMLGEVWMWFSLEIVSIDGRVHFFIRTPENFKQLVETQIYAQYPQAKVIEVDDYAFHMPKVTKDSDWNVWGCEFTKAREDFFPIKTYKGFGDEMKTGIKEEFKVDPITSTIESLGSLSKGQQLWMQITVRQSTKKYHSHHTGKHVDFHEAVGEFIEKLLEPYTTPGRVDEHGNVTPGKDVRTPESIKPVIKAITDQMGQLHYDCGIRVMTFSHKKLTTEQQFLNLKRDATLLFRQYDQPLINELRRINPTQFDAAWADPYGQSVINTKNKMLDFYRLRTLFYPPAGGAVPKIFSIFSPLGKPKPFVVSSEELATLYHFPGMVSETPSFKRIESKIAKPPANLPL